MYRKLCRSLALLLLIVPVGRLLAQTPRRIVAPVDDSEIVRLRGTTHQLATPANEIGRASSDLRMERVLLQVKRSPAQQQDLAQFLSELHDPVSAFFHRWLTPEQFGQRFGPSQEDLETISAWFQSHGLQVNGIAKGRSGRAHV